MEVNRWVTGQLPELLKEGSKFWWKRQASIKENVSQRQKERERVAATFEIGFLKLSRQNPYKIPSLLKVGIWKLKKKTKQKRPWLK